MNVLILGLNGFIGSSLVRAILDTTDWNIYGLDIAENNLTDVLSHERLEFLKGDICDNDGWLREKIQHCDVVLPLVAIAQPKLYGEDPLSVFKLDFEENLKIIKWVHEFDKWLIFPSTSEVYGMCDDDVFNEASSNFVYGPINRVRWIYASSKQLLDRLIYAYGTKSSFRFTIFRPFNWIGPNQDSLEAARKGHSRVVTQFFANLIDNDPIRLVDGGSQKRSFTDIDDGINALMTIMKNPEKSHGEIFNIGNPANNFTIRDLAEMLRSTYAEVAGLEESSLSEIVTTGYQDYYGKGKGFQDIQLRVPDISHIEKKLGWYPQISLQRSLRKCAEYFVTQQ
ncbi:MAG: bifunctional UDP-4-keto-pentose/UDP-xylose synthase [Chromatiales bacterium]|jgi:nucleoside-diphosphate-sugar epimerase